MIFYSHQQVGFTLYHSSQFSFMFVLGKPDLDYARDVQCIVSTMETKNLLHCFVVEVISHSRYITFQFYRHNLW